MEQTNILGRTTSPEEVKSAPSETRPGYALNVAVVYQDAFALKWAAQVCDQVARLTGKNAVHSSWWEISRLGDRDVLKDAIQTSAAADVILVSIYDANALPLNFLAWIDGWLACRRLPMGALIALITVPGQVGAHVKVARDFLHAVARKGRLDFLLRGRRLRGTPRGYFYMDKAEEWPDPTTSELQEGLRVE